MECVLNLPAEIGIWFRDGVYKSEAHYKVCCCCGAHRKDGQGLHKIVEVWIYSLGIQPTLKCTCRRSWSKGTVTLRGSRLDEALENSDTCSHIVGEHWSKLSVWLFSGYLKIHTCAKGWYKKVNRLFNRIPSQSVSSLQTTISCKETHLCARNQPGTRYTFQKKGHTTPMGSHFEV